MTDLSDEETLVGAKPAYEPAEFVDYGKASTLIATTHTGSNTDGGASPTNYVS